MHIHMYTHLIPTPCIILFCQLLCGIFQRPIDCDQAHCQGERTAWPVQWIWGDPGQRDARLFLLFRRL